MRLFPQHLLKVSRGGPAALFPCKKKADDLLSFLWRSYDVLTGALW